MIPLAFACTLFQVFSLRAVGANLKSDNEEVSMSFIFYWPAQLSDGVTVDLLHADIEGDQTDSPLSSHHSLKNFKHFHSLTTVKTSQSNFSPYSAGTIEIPQVS